MAEKRNAEIKIRLSPKEKFSWQQKAVYAGVSLSNLMRQAMARTNTWTMADRALIQEQTRQISRIGNNLNQIAKWANTYKSTASAIEVIEVLRAIEQALKQLTPQPTSSKPSAPKEPEANQDVT